MIKTENMTPKELSSVHLEIQFVGKTPDTTTVDLIGNMNRGGTGTST